MYTRPNIQVLENLTSLKRLYISWNKVRDASALSKLTNLEHLTIRGAELTDYSFLRNLNKLSSFNTSVWGEKIRYYRGETLKAFIESNGKER